MQTKFNIIIAAVVLFLVVLLSSVYVVNERELAVVTQFSRLVGTQEDAGLKFKVPLIQKVEKFDKRIQRLNIEPELFLTNEKKYLIVDYYVEWRIGDIQRFYTSVQGDVQRASTLLDQLVKDGLRGEFVQRSVSEVISEGRESIMENVTQQLSKDAERYGVSLIGVRLKRVDFSDDIRDRVFDRMRAERDRVSKSLRAQGQEKSKVIRATADREANELLATANAEAEIIRGKATAEAAKLYAKTYSKDLEFYEFSRSLEAYKHSFSSGEDVLIVGGDEPFLQYMRDMQRGDGSAIKPISGMTAPAVPYAPVPSQQP